MPCVCGAGDGAQRVVLNARQTPYHLSHRPRVMHQLQHPVTLHPVTLHPIIVQVNVSESHYHGVSFPVATMKHLRTGNNRDSLLTVQDTGTLQVW